MKRTGTHLTLKNSQNLFNMEYTWHGIHQLTQNPTWNPPNTKSDVESIQTQNLTVQSINMKSTQTRN